MIEIINNDCMIELNKFNSRSITCIFADPPDNIGLKYNSYNDDKPRNEYILWLEDFIYEAARVSDITWLSFNAKYTFDVAAIVKGALNSFKDLRARSCVQVYTFGQYNDKELGNAHRPLYLIYWNNSVFYPNNPGLRIESWRAKNGDKRAADRLRLPTDVFDFPRITGNSVYRKAWHPTQMNRDLIERCVLYSTKETDIVLDPFAGTGTTGLTCIKHNRRCILIEVDQYYCKKMLEVVLGINS